MALLAPERRPPSPLKLRPLPTALATLLSSGLFVVVLAFVARATADGVTVPPKPGAIVDAGPPLAPGPAGTFVEALVADVDAGVVVAAIGRDGGVTDSAADSDGGVTQGGVTDPVDGGVVVDDPFDDPFDGGLAPEPWLAMVEPDAGPPLVPVDAGPVYGASPDAGMEPVPPPSVDGPPFSPAEVAQGAVAVVETCAREALRWDPSLGGTFQLTVELPVAAAPYIVVDGLVSPVLSSCLERRAVDMAVPGSLRAAALEVPLAVRARASLDAAGQITWSDAVVVPGRNVNVPSVPE